MQIVVYDFETYYDSKSYTLSKMSAVDYVRDPRFHALCMGFSVNGSQPSVVEYDDIPYALRLLDLENPETLLIGHNSAGFDNLILSEVYGVHPAFMTDTMHLSRWSGLSRVCREGLASLTAHLKVGQKRTGTVMSDGLACKEQFMPAIWEDFKKYCAEDVINTGKILKLMMPFMTLDAIKFSSISCRMATEPCFIADADRLKAYLAELERKEADALATLKKTFNLPDDDSFLSEIRSARKFAAMLKLLGCDPPMKLSVKKTEANRKKIIDRGVIPPDQITDEMCAVYEPALAKTDLEFLDLLEHPDIRVRELVKIRLEHNSSIAKTRALNLLNMANYNKPFPILLKCYYAHTSRYGAGTSEGKSDGTNIQNLPKHNKQMEPLRQAIIVPKGYKVIACDSSQIEARCLAYAANFTELLNQFKEHRDPYAELAAKFGFGPTADEIHAGAKKGDPFLTKLRQAGKKGILSCVAGDTEVLTNHGWKPIVEVKVDDKVYDGEDFVEHKGLLPRGDKYTLCIDGVWITPDHLIYNGRSWCSARDCYNLSSALNLALLYGIRSVPIDISKQATEVHIDGRVQPVYDLVDCGDLNRFTIRTDSGALVIHNCGYGVGSSKYADSLWKEGVHLDEDKGTHNTIAKQAHDIYRQVSAPIVNFWGNCQKVIANLVGGLEGCWGGPNSSLFLFGKMPMPDGTEIPSIKLPSGFILRYPNLRLEQNDVGKPVYYYDRTLGKNIVATKIYGGALTENCIAKGTLVLTDKGWKPIETVGLTDLVYDGVAFVSHKGVVSKGVQDCIEMEGVFLTPDHKVLTTEANNGRTPQLVRPLWENAPQFQGYNRSSLREVDSYTQAVFQERQVVLGTTLRVRGDSGQIDYGINQSPEIRAHSSVPTMYQQSCGGQASYPWHDQYSPIQCMALNAIALRDPYLSCLSTLWGAWNNCVRAMAQVRDFLRRYGSHLPNWFSNRSYRQQWQLLPRELPLDNLQSQCQQQWKHLCRVKFTRFIRTIRDRFNNFTVQSKAWMAAGSFIRSARLSQRGEQLQQSPCVQKEVFDLMDCGPRHCFAIKSNAGGMIVHNCIQSFAFQVLLWQACRMSETGIKLACNIHDSFAAVVPESEAQHTADLMLQIMKTVPPWAEGLPIDAEVKIGDDFSIV